VVGFVTVVAWLEFSIPGSPTKANFNRVRLGMSENEVVELLGPWKFKGPQFGHQPDSPTECQFRNGPNIALVMFRDGRACDKKFHSASLANWLRWYWWRYLGREAPF
jgi:hypothetical protein